MEANSKEKLAGQLVIQLTRLNAKPLIVNSDLIEFIENAPDTVITLVTGEKIIVREAADEVIELVLRFRRRLLPTLAALPPAIDDEQKGRTSRSEEQIEDVANG